MESTPDKRLDYGKLGSHRLHRPLGPLEAMYHLYHMRGVDIIAQLICLETNTEVTLNDIERALKVLMARHPLLRMSIQERNRMDQKWFHFLEMDPHRIDLRETNEQNWEKVLSNTISDQFDSENGPLWRITVLNEKTNKIHFPSKHSSEKMESVKSHRLVFVFGCHHSLADGIYLQTIYSDFIETIDAIKMDTPLSWNITEKPLFLPPIENILPVVYPEQHDERTSRNKSYLAPRLSSMITVTTTGQRQLVAEGQNDALDDYKVLDALSAYQYVYKSEVSLLSASEQQTKTVRFKCPESLSRSILLTCKSKRITVTALCVTSACFALAELMKPSLPPQTECLTVLVEIMVNLRRYVTDKTLLESYPGVAAIHVPIRVNVPLDLQHGSAGFWKIARNCTDEIQRFVRSTKPIENMTEEVEKELTNKPVIGKSPFVICFTNLSSVDDVVKPDLQSRYKLVAFPGLTAITVNDMPIFMVNVFTLNKQLNVGIGYCGSYTGSSTAAKYSWHLKQFLTRSESKL